MSDRAEFDINALTDPLLGLHRDFDYLDENTLDLRVANTLINLLEGVARPSGPAGPPRLVPYRRVTFAIPE